MIQARRMRRFLTERVLYSRSLPGAGPTFGEAWLKIKTVEGWLVPGQEKWLFNAAQNLPDGANIVEIGSFKGRSTASMGMACLKTNKRIFAIDTFQGNDSDFVKGQNEIEWSGDTFFREFWGNMERVGVQDHVIPLAGLSYEIAKYWRAPIHLLFVDGSHQYDDALKDFKDFFPYVVSGGIIAFHDVTPEWAGVYKLWNEMISPQLRNSGAETTLAFGYKP